MRQRLPLPKAIQNAPSLMMGLELYWDAFWDLRTTSDGASAISFLHIVEYAEKIGLSEEQTSDLLFFIPTMNVELSAHLKKKENA